MSQAVVDGGVSACLAKFQAKGQPQSTSPIVPKKKGFRMKFSAPAEKCEVCDKRVYEMEKITADEKIFHKYCFKCDKCKRTLGLGNYASLDGAIFCKPHFIELFKQKGNYEEGFGKERHKNKWSTSNPEQQAVESNKDEQQSSGRDHVDNEETAHFNLRNIKNRFEEKKDEVAVAPPQTSRSRSSSRRSRGESLASVEDHPVTNGYVNGEANGEMNGHAVNGDDSHTQEINGHDANGHANDEEEEKENKRESFHFKGMASVRNMFEQRSSSSSAPVPNYSRANYRHRVKGAALRSKYEQACKETETFRAKPVQVTPAKSTPNLYHSSTSAKYDDEEQEEEVKPRDMQSLLAKFKSMENISGKAAAMKPKPKHVITPPREPSPSPNRPRSRTSESEPENYSPGNEATRYQSHASSDAMDQSNMSQSYRSSNKESSVEDESYNDNTQSETHDESRLHNEVFEQSTEDVASPEYSYKQEHEADEDQNDADYSLGQSNYSYEDRQYHHSNEDESGDNTTHSSYRERTRSSDREQDEYEVQRNVEQDSYSTEQDRYEEEESYQQSSYVEERESYSEDVSGYSEQYRDEDDDEVVQAREGYTYEEAHPYNQDEAGSDDEGEQ